MAGKGGYQAPAKPAMISGPGSMSKRTDGGPASKQALRYVSGMPNYGDGQDLMNLQASAPMAGVTNQPTGQTTTAAPAGPAQPQGNPLAALGQQATPLFAPSNRPQEPVTAGANSGPGPDASSLPNPAQNNGFVSALALLNSLGDNVSTQVKSIRNVLQAHVNNQVGK